MSKLVSVIIPCFNAEKWLAEAIESCLKQTYAPLEIIVVDDGSTDGSLEIIRRFGEKIRWVSGPNCGGNHARNRGFQLAQGDYIQFLDADDYLYPEKIARQVQALDTEAGDFVYGDWQYQNHKFGDHVVLGEVQVAGAQDDLLASLLGLWWVATASLLYRREIVTRAGGWDETLPAAQDRDFLLSVVMAGGQAIYQPGCVSVYRRYGNVTVSTVSMARYVQSHLRVLQKAEHRLTAAQRHSKTYRRALAQSHFALARFALKDDFSKYLICLEKTLTHCADFQAERQLAMAPAFPETGVMTALYHWFQARFGFQTTESLFRGVLRVKLNWDAYFTRLKDAVRTRLDKSLSSGIFC
ncbi:MAG: glycosyltransferase [Nodosilinea sp.]